MMRKCLRWARSRWKRLLALSLLTLFLLVNVLAYMHARAMIRFAERGSRTDIPEKLSWWQKCKVLLTGVTIPRPENGAAPDSLGLTFETIRLPGGDSFDLEAWLVPHARGRAVVLMFHGYTSCKADMLREAQAFHELGYVPFLVDFRGSGGSGGDETSIGVYEADDVARVVDYARARWPAHPIVLYGQSMGSAAILRALAVQRTQASAVIIEGPFDRLLSTVENRFASMGLPKFPGAQLLVFWGGVQQGFNGFRHNPVEYAAAVDVPVLVLHGETDVRATKAQAESVFDNLAGPKRIEFFGGVGHEPCLAADCDQWKRSVSGFLRAHVTVGKDRP